MEQQDHNKLNQQAVSPVTNQKPRTAIALSYEPNEAAPKVIASGKGYLADKIIERAKEADVPLHKDEKLADTLSKLQIGDTIPAELYEVVAEILVFVDKMDRIKDKVDRSNE
jgi:flagellar biosynthesis protein